MFTFKIGFKNVLQIFKILNHFKACLLGMKQVSQTIYMVAVQGGVPRNFQGIVSTLKRKIHIYFLYLNYVSEVYEYIKEIFIIRNVQFRTI